MGWRQVYAQVQQCIRNLRAWREVRPPPRPTDDEEMKSAFLEVRKKLRGKPSARRHAGHLRIATKKRLVQSKANQIAALCWARVDQ